MDKQPQHLSLMQARKDILSFTATCTRQLIHQTNSKTLKMNATRCEAIPANTAEEVELGSLRLQEENKEMNDTSISFYHAATAVTSLTTIACRNQFYTC